MPIIDTHAHIDEIEDWPSALVRAKEAGVSDIVAVSLNLESMRKILALAASSKEVRIHPALGVHPEMIEKGLPGPEVFDFIRQHIKEAVAIGETGLDFWYKAVKDNQEEKDKQRSSFSRHLELAKEYDLPIIIHSRGAWRDCLDMVKQAGVTKALFHWYSGPIDVLEGVLEAGFYVSTSPSVGYSPQSQQAMLAANVERILIETDSPVTYRGEEGSYKSEPKDVVKTLKALSRLKNIDEDKLLSIVNQNAKKFFGPAIGGGI
jgi:TatD DNase family protein